MLMKREKISEKSLKRAVDYFGATAAELNEIQNTSNRHPGKDLIAVVWQVERTLFLVGTIIIISAILEARSSRGGLTAYHALIVLNLSQINNWAGFLIIYSRYGFRESKMVLKLKPKLATVRGVKDLVRVAIERHGLLFLMHTAFVSGFGIWFWSKPRSPYFLRYADPYIQLHSHYTILFVEALPGEK